MATEILVNDGGAPARIIPIIANEAITAGDAIGLVHVASGNAKAIQLDSADTSVFFVGVALADAAADAVCNVVTGRGVVCMINAADVNGGVGLMASTTDGQLTTYADGTELYRDPVALTLEDNGAAGLTKCLIL
jgi:hypothetical protein